MDPDRWNEIRAALEEAIALESTQRDTWLRARQEADPELAREVEALLAEDAEGASFEPPTRDPLVDLLGIAPLADGTRLGAYETRGAIASGGMGTVYRAERADAEFEKQVAIKVIKPGMDSAEILRRFKHERQVLAALEHPGIARLLDGGATPDGRPYLVMELVPGEPIDQYCDRNGLAIPERLRLFQRVCTAVHYAHQRLVVHRDLKPNNILVTKDGEPKLLDFGIARVLDKSAEDGTYHTMGESQFLTPDFASPEQVRGERVTTASDVYSLGVVLYDILTGLRPHDLTKRSRSEVHRIVCEVEPARPSDRVLGTDQAKLRGRLVGDLDNVVLMALRKEPERRYASAEQLAEDIGRHLDGMPVIARPDTFRYRASKFVGRNRTPVAISALLVLALAVGFFTSSHLYVRAAEATEDAERRFGDVRQLAETIIFDISEDLAPMPGATRARERIVAAGLDYLDGLASEAQGDDQLQLEVADAFLKIGDVQGGMQVDNLGQADEARESYERAHAILERLGQEVPPLDRVVELQARSWIRRGDLAVQDSDTQTSLECYRRALELLGDRPGELAFGERQAANERLAQHFVRVRDLSSARAHREAIVTAAESWSESEDTDAARLSDAIARVDIAEIELFEGDFEASEATNRAAIEALEPLLDGELDAVPARKALGKALHGLARTLAFMKRQEEALEATELALVHFRWLAEADLGNVQSQRNLGIILQQHGYALAGAGRIEEGLTAMRESLAIKERASDGDPDNAASRRSVTLARRGIAEALVQAGEIDEGLEELDVALGTTRELLTADPGNLNLAVDLAICEALSGVAHLGRAQDESLGRSTRVDALAEARRWIGDSEARLRELEAAGLMAPGQMVLFEVLARDSRIAGEVEDALAASTGE